MKKLLIATTNTGKLQEIKTILNDLFVDLISLKDLGITIQAKEDFSTFKENAIYKAKFYSKLSGLPTIADDGGLEIDFLKGLPGVRSRRWVNGSENISDQEIINYTLLKMQGVPVEKRKARLRTVVAFCIGNNVFSDEGTVEGIIAFKQHSVVLAGFPYRSLLFLPEIKKYYHNNELTIDEKEKYNHRQKVLKRLRSKIQKYLIES